MEESKVKNSAGIKKFVDVLVHWTDAKQAT